MSSHSYVNHVHFLYASHLCRMFGLAACFLSLQFLGAWYFAVTTPWFYNEAPTKVVSKVGEPLVRKEGTSSCLFTSSQPGWIYQGDPWSRAHWHEHEKGKVSCSEYINMNLKKERFRVQSSSTWTWKRKGFVFRVHWHEHEKGKASCSEFSDMNMKREGFISEFIGMNMTKERFHVQSSLTWTWQRKGF